MADEGLCSCFKEDDVQYYQGAPFIPGIFEYQFMPGRTTDREKKLAKLIHAYQNAFNLKKGPVKLTYPVSRVITVDKAIESRDTIHTYDQIQTYIDKYDPISVSTCYCRHGAKLRGEDIHGMPTDVCMFFGRGAEYAIDRLKAKSLTKKEAREVLDRAEEAGLVHMARNTAEDIEFVCNCDRWHCGPVTLALAQPKPGLFFNSGFEPRFDPELCSACETCLDRCPASALSMGDNDVPEIDLDRCFGCAVCVTGCPTEAISMASKPGFQEPPKDRAALSLALKNSRG